MFIWKDDYSIGIDSVDEQHKNLFLLGKELDEIVKKNEKNDNFADIILAISKLLEYTTDHFESEEKYMKSIEYPKLDEQIKEHKKMIDYISQVDIHHMESSQHDTIQSLVDFLGNWILQHILEKDQQITDFVENKS